MPSDKSSLNNDRTNTQSCISDKSLGLSEVLREARQRKQLSQQGLARKLGLRQRQISDLERATTDSRLSTIQNVARALDLELMLIPRHLIAAVEALQRAGTAAAKRPLYALDDETEDVSGESRHLEVGDTSAVQARIPRQRRARKGSRR